MLVMALGKFFSNWVKGIYINSICRFLGALLKSGNSVTINPLLRTTRLYPTGDSVRTH
jgi:hypothetical protein